MQTELTEEQIAQARELRAAGKSYPEIAEQIAFDGAPGLIRNHCLDVPTPDGRTRVDKPVMERSDGKGVIRAFTEEEDMTLLTEFARHGAPEGWPKGHKAAIAKQLGRKQHSVAARMKTLQKRGKIQTG